MPPLPRVLIHPWDGGVALGQPLAAPLVSSASPRSADDQVGCTEALLHQADIDRWAGGAIGKQSTLNGVTETQPMTAKYNADAIMRSTYVI